ncbi:hypothetical protein C6P41_004559 [Kluyveromyces marxianus]|nr:hypothetical protein C6P41_004559 [Kluyveromyces marxianus]
MSKRSIKKVLDVSQMPDFSRYSPTKSINELAPYISKTLSAYPSESKYINQQHYYHNENVLVEKYLPKQPHPMSLKQLAQYYDDSSKLTRQKILNSGKFVKEELCVRIAHKINRLQNLPFNLVNNFHFNQVYESYYNIFERFRKFPEIKDEETNLQFAKFLHAILSDFNSLNLPHLIMGALESCILDLYPQDKMDQLISELLRARISRRLIVEEHLSMTSNYLSGRKENMLVLGDIFQNCSAKAYLHDARTMCEAYMKNMYFDGIKMPQLILHGDTDLEFYFLPSHLKFLLGEILRNKYEATVKETIRLGLDEAPPIVVMERYTQTSLDHMTETNLKKGRFKFEKPLIDLLQRSPRYKLGIGLALCKVYAEYWNGDLTVHSIQGYGTDTVLKLGNLMTNTDRLQLDRV